ncbi:cysteine proteinase [Cryphonectria parasitica EP155]|uniref:ubiquitinyl hydrolase 1 n=1 Tax=Cryphonectria parasitica (strain ATCC 38755 / EP155) TaxID=660469 RepID=A0A9P5CTR6_CRYP1|nr:cysteine proteinase [Cryphonectria parasitica EP155]KAF3770929.1 cysteine proteinase [Cryphonectria parasitica EP155]
MKASIPKRLLTLRDRDRDKEKNGSHGRSKSSEGHKSTESSFLSVFKSGLSTTTNGDVDKEKESAKIDEIDKRLAEMDIHDISKEHLRFALRSKYAAGDTEKAIEMLLLHQRSMSGTILPYDPKIHMVGAENRGNVTCYLDALLFAMFAKLEAFECMLKNDLSDEPQRNLASLIRLWVNMLRSGKLIHTDFTQLIQDALAACGWKDAQLLEQQDTSEAFAFITETLQLPLLTLQVDLFHQGKGDKDDHKVVYERLLNLAVPVDPEGKGVKLEDCLEDYFNTRVDVSRVGVEEKLDRPILTPQSTIRLVKMDPGEEAEIVDQVDGEPLQRRWTVVEPTEPADGPSTSDPERPAVRHRSTSIIQRIVLDADGKATESDAASLLQKAKRKGSTVVKAVTIPAWQFFRLIPWHAVPNTEPKTDGEILMHFNQRPVVGICLKRYLVTEDGRAKRQNTFIDIPDSLRLPRFMVADDAKVEEDTSLSTEYKLVLQSVVCHRGDSVHSGHYISFARVNPKLLTDNRRHDNDPPPDYEDAQWVKFDDLALENRVSNVDDIKASLKNEMPYLLFYQIVPMVDVTNISVTGSETEPPSYDDSTLNAAVSNASDSERPGLSRAASGYFDMSTLSSTGPSIRFSSELERPPRLSLSVEDDVAQAPALLSPNASRRGSVAVSEPILGNLAITPETGSSPVVTPIEETTAQRLSRAAAKFTKSGTRSRPTSQAGESRISITMSRLSLKSKSKEPLREAWESVEGDEETPVAVVVPERLSIDGEEKKDKEHHHHHHLHGKKKRAKSKSRSGDKDTEKVKRKGEVPDRECIVM